MRKNRLAAAAVQTLLLAAITGSIAPRSPASPQIALLSNQQVEPALQGCLEPLSTLLGDWQGDAVFTTRTGTTKARAEEKARAKIGGKALLLEGRGWRTTDSGETIVVHDALAILSCSADDNQIVMRAYSAGRHLDATVVVNAESLRWSFTPPKGPQVRNTLELGNPGTWREISEISQNGKEWTTVLETNLLRVEYD